MNYGYSYTYTDYGLRHIMGCQYTDVNASPSSVVTHCHRIPQQTDKTHSLLLKTCLFCLFYIIYIIAVFYQQKYPDVGQVHSAVLFRYHVALHHLGIGAVVVGIG